MAKQEHPELFREMFAHGEKERVNWHRLCLTCREFGVELPDWARTVAEAAVLVGYNDSEIASGKIAFHALRRRVRLWAAGRRPEQKWSEAKSPTDWCKELGVSLSTLKRRVETGRLVVDKHTSKSWSIRLDTLRLFRGDK